MMSYLPPFPPEPPVLARMAAFVAPAPSLAATCERVAQAFRAMAADAYDEGDQARGDRLTGKGIAWQLAGQTGSLDEVRL